MSTNYDRIARFYDVDMGRNMVFDDINFYARQCAMAPGPVLELGCGNGRILLELLARGVDAAGVDASDGMLRELLAKAASRRLPAPRICRMDIRRLAFARGSFATVLCPYSLVTYLNEDAELAAMLQGVRCALAPVGTLIIDAFVPRPVVPQADFRLIYRRPVEDGEILRWKRINPVDAEHNRIERRYQRLGADGHCIEEIEVVEVIRPYRQEDLERALRACHYEVTRVWGDYGRHAPTDAQFIAIAARPTD